MNPEEPVNQAAVIKFLAGLIAILGAKYAPTLGVNDTFATAAATVLFAVACWLIARVTRARVTSLAKLKRVMPANEHEALMAKLNAPSPKVSSAMLVFLVAAAAALVGCAGMSALEVVKTVASDAGKIAQVLCLADQSKRLAKPVDAITVQEICQTVEQLAPYMAVAQNPGLVLQVPVPAEPSDAGGGK